MAREAQPLAAFADFYKMTTNGVVVWRTLLKAGSQNRFNFHNPDTPLIKKITYQGEITEHSRRRLSKAIQLLADITEPHYVYNEITNKRQKFLLAFWTLTLSAPQYFISDSQIKKQLLEPFLRKMRAKGLKNYIWKAELQQNGNIHFHLLTDFFMEYYRIRDMWNNCQSQLGFISDFERRHGHRDPNSTDVKAVNNIKNLAAYLSKYMLKPTKKSQQQKLAPVIDLQRKGKVWDCSLNLKLKNTEYDFLTDTLYTHLLELESSKKIRVLHEEFYKMFFLDKQQRKSLIPAQYLTNFENYLERVKAG